MTRNELFKLAGNVSDPLVTAEIQCSNDFYGHAYTLKKHCLVENNYQIKAVIEHGARISQDMWDHEVQAPLPGYLVMGVERARQVSSITDKLVTTIGPYIHYAPSSLESEAFKNEKKRLGKTLLVFPAHSTHWINVEFDIKFFLDIIKRYAKDYNSVVVCLYWKDILLNYDEIYRAEGFDCFTAGHMYDNEFLSRLRFIIELSDTTISNSFGTHVGYCVYLNKSHCLVEQEKQHVISRADIPGPAAEHLSKEYYLELKKLFKDFGHQISSQQHKAMCLHWGLQRTKNINDIKTLFHILDDAYSHSFHMEKGNIGIKLLNKYVREGKFDLALYTVDMVLDLHQNKQFLKEKVVILNELGQTKEALRELKSFIRKFPGDRLAAELLSSLTL
ncbi:hypothetical protein V6C53_01125 [Desulfocurvibacter africanus]|uniref:hypothetical protein n=1 Tax=Desulfocurvibacter africanus TaxID=873 RepID=UPI002FDA503D